MSLNDKTAFGGSISEIDNACFMLKQDVGSGVWGKTSAEGHQLRKEQYIYVTGVL